jgi:hypothetical protein
LNVQIEVLKQKFLFEFSWFVSFAVGDWNIMFEAKFFKDDLSFLVFEFLCVIFFLDDWSLFEHEEQVFHVYTSLVNFSKESTHVEKWSSHLHKECLYHHEITCGHGAHVNSMSCHQEVDG